MSNSTSYVVLGVKLPFAFFSEDERLDLEARGFSDNVHSKTVGHKHGITVIADGMSGEYIVAGRVLARARHDDGEGLEFLTLDITDGQRQEVLEALATHLRITSADIQPLVFTHWS